MSFTNEEDNSDLSSCERILIDTNTSNNQKLNDNEQYVFNKDLIISEVLPQFMSPTIEGFINRMRTNNEWGNEITLRTAADLYKRDIVVYRSDKGAGDVPVQFGKNGKGSNSRRKDA